MSEGEKPKTARSYRGTVVDDNAIISINIKWLIQMSVLIAGIVYGYFTIEMRIRSLESRVAEADTQIEVLVAEHIEASEIKYAAMEEELKWYQTELNLNPLSWKKKRKKK